MHDEWLPFNDFLIVDVSSGGRNLHTLEISYDSRVNLASQALKIDCDGKQVLSQKYKVRVTNGGNVKGKLTVIFTSFLFNSIWAVTNIKLLQACSGFSMLDPLT